jgi:hypothetical protein
LMLWKHIPGPMTANRLIQLTLIVSILCISWLWMMIVHELGHVILAWTSGETVSKVVLHPLAISRTDTSHEKHPLLVIWGGPAIGSLLPACVFFAAKILGFKYFYLFRFFAGFCLVANGAYLGVGSFSSIGDAGDLARAGCPRTIMVVFGLVCAAAGFGLWNGLGPYFGMKQAGGKVDRTAALAVIALLAATVIVEIVADSR